MGMRILYAGRASENLLRLRRMAECFGIATELVDVRVNQSLPMAIRKMMAEKNAGWVLDVESLKDYANQNDELKEAADLLESCDAEVLLFATDNDELTNRFLRTLARDKVLKVDRKACALSVKFPLSGRALSGELASQSYSRQVKEALTLTLAHNSKATSVMELDAAPAFVRFCLGRARMFIWSTTDVFDVHRQLAAEKEFEDAADEYIPAIIFLRSAFGDRCWHNPSAGAGIVIDDPLLKRDYGFINFPQLLGSARKHGYRITLAFIPWNHWRSRAKDVKMFCEHLDCFNICAHGCDHTRNEFRTTNYEELLNRNFIASRRMERQRERFGIGTESLMVCPREQYSLEAMRAFADSRQFVGLICTACMPRNLTAPQICGADLLLPAQDSFYGFPVFKRHYWNGMAVFAMALFLGKPAILVEHHEFFRNGPSGTEEFARRLVELRPDLKWRSLAETVTRTHTRRSVSKNKQEVRFFTDTFHFEHELEQPMEYGFLRRIPKTTHVEFVRIGGKEVPFSRDDGFLRFETHAQHPQTLAVQVKVVPVEPTRSYSPGVRYQASVAVRRYLSELRDNIVARNHFALRASRFVMTSLKQAVRRRQKESV